VRLEVDALVRRRAGFRLSVSLRADARCLAVVGPSGSGKTTLLDVIAGVERGRVAIDGEEIGGLPLHRRSVGYVMQEAPLFPHLTVRGNLAYGPTATGIEAVARSLGIAHLLDRMPRHLSGGERRRAALARALAGRPRLLLLDEPFAGLDEESRRDAMSLLRRTRETHGVPMVLVSHSPAEVVGLADLAIRLEGGVAAAQGPSASLLRAGESGIDNFFVAAVSGRDRVRTAACELSLPLPEGASGAVRLACHASDVLLARERPARISARNVVPTRILSLEPAGGSVLVAVEDPPLRALVTAEAARELDLRPGETVFVVLKSTAIAFLGPAE
jgi:molybdate transport system ATP-binding protein